MQCKAMRLSVCVSACSVWMSVAGEYVITQSFAFVTIYREYFTGSKGSQQAGRQRVKDNKTGALYLFIFFSPCVLPFACLQIVCFFICVVCRRVQCKLSSDKKRTKNAVGKDILFGEGERLSHSSIGIAISHECASQALSPREQEKESLVFLSLPSPDQLNRSHL